MAKGTDRQKQIAEQYANPRVGMCIVPYCKSILPAKGRFHGMCWWHYCRVGYWAGKAGHDLSWSGNPFADDYKEKVQEAIQAYCDWLKGKLNHAQSNHPG